jgi:hypothetical protein
MEFTWRMFGTLAWPAVILVGLVVYRKWITEKITLLRFKLGHAELELSIKVEQTALKVGRILDAIRGQSSDDNMSMSLVDLMLDVSRDRRNGIRKAFDQVLQVLFKYHPSVEQFDVDQLSEHQFSRKMHDLVAHGMDQRVAESVTQLYELLKMPEWDSDSVGDTRGYAFLMLAEGVINGIARSARSRSGDRPASADLG